MSSNNISTSTPMRLLKSVSATLLLSVFAPFLLADEAAEKEMSNGELAGIIRSAGQPCNSVIEFQSSGKNAWNVTCNSGAFFVKRGEEGNYSVSVSG